MPFIFAFLVMLDTLWGLVAPRPLPPLTGEVDRIVVDKSDRTLSLIQDGRVVRTYPVGLGFAPEGDKNRQGDGRTPEGLFRIDRRNDLHPRGRLRSRRDDHHAYPGRCRNRA